ncbi:hypothetical protein OVY48_11235 [Sphingobium sp. SA2]|jgi:hypothetical protein|uniref:hypothetical protein n=1 Tax=unclassified Sphingobium TaxID=2611147 RepID=UPI000560B81D|nr:MULTISPECIES: hypothetical protein [unclassified Sphingobium]MDT7533997.1 hypothetical protein [Sphingobium sp. SA2]PBN44579.1 hypothetical protein SxD43FB_05255 [Sphingobium sp. D43FB]
MATVDGAYDCVAKTPMGDQNGVFTVISNGDRFNGTFAGMMGSLDVVDGKVAGDVLTWKMEMTMPMPMTLECEATVSGDAITGTMQLGAFGASAFTGTRRA